MRVLFITNTFPPGYTGGAEVANYHTCQGLMQRGLTCSFLSINHRMLHQSDEWYELDNIPVHQVHFKFNKPSRLRDLFDQRIYRVVLAELQQVKPDIVHIMNVSGSSLAPYMACRRMRIPVVNTLHDLWLLCPNNILYQQDGRQCDSLTGSKRCQNCFRRYDFWADVPYRRKIFAALTSNVKFFISPSQGLIDRHLEAGYDPARFRLIRFGFPVQVVPPPLDPEMRQLLRDLQGQRLVVFAGGGIEIKGAHVVIQAIPLILPYVENLRIVVVGGGEDHFMTQFRAYVPSVLVLGRIFFKDMAALFMQADLTIFASVCHENSPLTIFENLQVGTPIVGSNYGTVPEFVREQKTGYLFSVGDAAALAEKIILHFARPAQARRRMRLHCAEEIQTWLPPEKYMSQLLDLYQEILSI